MSKPKKWSLQGSATSLDGLKDMLETLWYWREVSFEPKGKVYSVRSTVGIVEGCRVRKEGKRYRFEMESTRHE